MDIDELDRLMKAATTSGPFKYSPQHIEEGASAVRSPLGWIFATTASDTDAAFIVAACNALPDLIAEVRRLREALRQIGKFRGQFDIVKDGNLQTAVAIADAALGEA